MIFLVLFAGTYLANAQVQVGEKAKLSGLLFGDYFWMAENHDPDLEGENGFWIRRIYLTYDRELSDSFSARVRLEMSGEGDFVSSAKMRPVVKDAYLEWERGEHAFTAGISNTPTWALVEEVWGYRSVEQTPLDLQAFGSSRDFGIAAEGELDPDGKLQYHFMFGNGNSNNSEIDRGKKWMLSLGYQLTENVVVEVYGDWNDLEDDTDYYTLQGFVGYQSETVNAGFLYAYQKRKNFFAVVGGDLDLDLNVVSAFANYKFSEKATGLLRIDHSFDPNPLAADNDYIPLSDEAESTFIVGGVDVTLDERVHIIPNIEAIIYGENAFGLQPGSDLIPRLTLFFTF